MDNHLNIFLAVPTGSRDLPNQYIILASQNYQQEKYQIKQFKTQISGQIIGLKLVPEGVIAFEKAGQLIKTHQLSFQEGRLKQQTQLEIPFCQFNFSQSHTSQIVQHFNSSHFAILIRNDKKLYINIFGRNSNISNSIFLNLSHVPDFKNIITLKNSTINHFVTSSVESNLIKTDIYTNVTSILSLTSQTGQQCQRALYLFDEGQRWTVICAKNNSNTSLARLINYQIPTLGQAKTNKIKKIVLKQSEETIIQDKQQIQGQQKRFLASNFPYRIQEYFKHPQSKLYLRKMTQCDVRISQGNTCTAMTISCPGISSSTINAGQTFVISDSHYSLNTVTASIPAAYTPYITFDSSTNTFTSLLTTPSGAAVITVVLSSSPCPTFTLTIIGSLPPLFVPALAAQTVLRGQTLTYSVSYSDPEGFTPVGVIVTGLTSPNYIITYTQGVSSGVFTINPAITAALTPITISVQLSDGINSPSYSFTVTPLDNPPTFTTTPSNQVVNVGNSFTYPILATDIELDLITYSALISPLSPSYISLASDIFTVAVSLWSQITITYTVAVTLSDPYVSQTPAIFTIQIVNLPPVITLASQSVQVGQILIYPITISDPESSPLLLIVSATGMTSSGTTLSGSTFTIAPSQLTLTGVYPVIITVTDGAQTATQTLSITVINLIPTFTTALADQTLFRGTTVSYPVSVIDPESFTVTVSYTPVKTWMTIVGSTFSIAPPLTTLTGIYPITVILFDGAMYGTSTFNVVVLDAPPAFSSVLVNQTVYIGNTITYQLPAAVDPDGITPVILTYQLPAFASFAGANKLQFSPTTTDLPKVYQVNITLSDGINHPIVTLYVNVLLAPISTSFAARLASLMNPGPPTFQSALSNKVIVAGQSDSLNFPSITNPEANNTCKVTIILAAAAPFTSVDKAQKTLSFNPKISDLGTSTIIITLSNTNSSTSYKIIVSVVKPASLIAQTSLQKSKLNSINQVADKLVKLSIQSISNSGVATVILIPPPDNEMLSLQLNNQTMELNVVTAKYAPSYDDQKTVLKQGIIIPFTVLTVQNNIITLQLNFTNGSAPFKVSMQSVRQFYNIYRNPMCYLFKLMKLS